MTSLTAGVTALEANVTPGAPSQTTGHPSEPGDIFESSRLDCHQTAENWRLLPWTFRAGRRSPDEDVG
jgi:transposase